MLESVRNIFNIPDLRKRILFTFLLLAVYRLGAQVPTPGIDGGVLSQLFEQRGGSFLGFLNMFTGKALSRLTIFALGIMPYISASIILQLLTVVVPYLEKLSKEGEMGRKTITRYTRYGTVLLSIIQSTGIAIGLENMAPIGGQPIVPSPGWSFRLMTVLTLTTGTAFIMWIGEQITERGIGNGISLIIFAGIVVGFMPAIFGTFKKLQWGDPIQIIQYILLVVFMVFVVAVIVFVERGQRRFPVQYAKRVVGRRQYGGGTTHLPLKVNTGGVIPVIFASSIIIFPQTIANMFKDKSEAIARLSDMLSWGQWLYTLIYVAGIIFFCYFYTSIIFNPTDVADNMRKYGGFIPGIRPGKRTAEFIDKVLSRITFGGAIYLATIAILPEWMISGFKVNTIPFIGAFLDTVFPTWITRGLGVQFFFGGTSLLIVVGVAMDTVQQVESQLIMRHYDGFLKTGRMRGRRS